LPKGSCAGNNTGSPIPCYRTSGCILLTACLIPISIYSPFYLFTFTQVILRVLQKHQFKCPGYSHLYISIGETEEEAIAKASDLEDWYRFGVAVMTKEELLNASDDELEALMLEKITDGLKDIAALDSLIPIKLKTQLSTPGNGESFMKEL
jgi:hypothetical protein